MKKRKKDGKKGEKLKPDRLTINGKSIKKSVKLILMAVFIVMIPFSAVYAGACNPISATLCAAVDDYAWIYLNGTMIDTFTYCDIGWSCEPKCVYLNSTQLALLNDTGNVIATFIQNTNCCEVWGSWSLAIMCTGGGQVFASSDDTPIRMLSDTTCMCAPAPTEGEACNTMNPSPTPQGGYQWYQPLYQMTPSAWVDPIDMTGWKWGKRIYDPKTGSLLHSLSYVAAMHTNCGAIWFRNPAFSLTPMNTPLPPAFTILKSANPTTGIQGPGSITYTLHICNTGGGTLGNVLQVIDIWHPTASNGWRFNYFIYGGANVGWSYTDTNFGSISADVNGPPTTITFNDGFINNACIDLVYSMYADNPVSQCLTWYNDANLAYLGSPTIVSTVTLRNFCPSPTATPTVTSTIPAPVFTLLKTADKTTNITNSDQISFNLHICNTGGYVTNPLTIFDDWSSSPDNWQYSGPWNHSDPMTAGNISQGGGTKNYTFSFQNGFPGGGYCYELGFTITTYGNPVTNCFTWYNKAYLTYLASPTLVSTVTLSDFCPSATVTVTLTGTRTTGPSPTITPTITIAIGSSTFTRTNTFTITPTFTITATFSITMSTTVTYTYTPSITPTFTMTPTTPPVVIALTKTIDKHIFNLGEQVNYCLVYTNNGTAAASFTIWDTIPGITDFISCTGGCSQVTFGSYHLLVWNMTSVPAGYMGQVCFVVQINRMPFLMRNREFLALLDDKRWRIFSGKGFDADNWDILFRPGLF